MIDMNIYSIYIYIHVHILTEILFYPFLPASQVSTSFMWRDIVAPELRTPMTVFTWVAVPMLGGLPGENHRETIGKP